MATRTDHARAAHRDCRRVLPDRFGCGGTMFWGDAEPQWATKIGLVGTCAWCGYQAFTADLLGEGIEDYRRGRELPSRWIAGVRTAA